MPKVVTYVFRVRVLALLILATCFFTAEAQKTYRLYIDFVESQQNSRKADLKLKPSFNNRQQCADYIAKLPALLQARGYIAASIDSVAYTDTAAHLKLYLGNNFSFRKITLNEADRLVLEQVIGKKLEKTSFSPVDLPALQQALLNHFENSGYPFASVQFDSVSLDASNMIGAKLSIEKGILYKIDSIRVYGSLNISKDFLHRYLNIERGSIYSREKMEDIDRKLLELPYLQQVQPWEIVMLSTGSIINLYLGPKKSNQVDVLAGFLPGNGQTGKLLLTVDANLQLKNAFGTGESIGLVWQQIQPRSPRLNLQYMQPYFLRSPFGVDLSFELFKKDSTFLNINAQAGLQYLFSANQGGRLLVQHTRSNVLDADTFTVKNLRRLPDIADVSAVNIGFNYEFNKTNYRLNPQSGSQWRIYAGAGNKTIRKNSAITQIKDPAFDYSSLYDSIKLKTYRLQLEVEAAHYFPLGRQSVVKTAINSGWLQSPNYFRNELFQVGGYRLLRGFDEESIFASKYAVGTVEYRYLLGLNSYFFAFTDVGWSRNESLPTSIQHNYVGGGLGLSFETKGGLFNISFAAGKRNDLDFSIKQSKIHFGYVSIF